MSETTDRSSVTEQNPHLARSVKHGVLWSLFNAGSAKVLSLFAGLIIVRLVTPREYGVYAVGFLVLTAITSMNELGVSVVVARSPTDPTPLGPTATTMSLATSLSIYGVVFALAPTLAHVLGTSSATGVIRLISLNVVLDGLSSVPNAFLMRSFQQGRRTIVDVVSFFPGAGVAIGLAAAGWGPMALAWGSLAGNVTAVVMVYALAPSRPLPGWNRAHARALVSAGLPFAATSAVYLATLNVDYVVVGHFLGPVALGFYLLAFNLSSAPASLVSLAIRRVAIPAFGRLAHDRDALAKAFVRSLHLVAALAVIMAVLMSTLARPLVTVLYGHTWLPAVGALRWLAFLGALRVLFDLCYDVLVGSGRGRRLLVVQFLWLAGLIAVLPVAARHGGITGVGIGHILVAVAIVVPAYGFALHGVGLRLPNVGRALLVPLLAGAATVGVVEGAVQLTSNSWAQLGAVSVLAGLFYGVLVAFEPQNREFLRGVGHRIRWRSPLGARRGSAVQQLGHIFGTSGPVVAGGEASPACDLDPVVAQPGG
jgi:PST family polysaccharide transporter